MRTVTTFRSEEDEWAWIERMARRRERLFRAARYAALFAFGTALLFAILWLCVRNMGERRYDPWQNAIQAARQRDPP